MKRLLLLTYYWPPAGGAGVQRWLKMTKYLPEMDVRCTVITVHPDYASYPVVDRTFEAEVHPEVEVIRTRSFEPLKLYGKIAGRDQVPHGGFANVDTGTAGSKVSRWMRGNLFIPDARKGWNKYAKEAALDMMKQQKFDALITTGPPHSTHLVGLELKKETGIRWIADFRDPWTDIYYYGQLLHTAWARRRDRKLEQSVLNMADVVLSVCPSNAQLLKAKLPLAAQHKVHILTNGYDEADFSEPVQPLPKDILQIAYVGTIAPMYAPEPVIDALERLPFNWQLTMAGSVAPSLKERFESEPLRSKVSMAGYLPHADALRLLRQSHVLLHIVPDTDANRMGTTGKLFEYIGSGVPILNIGPKEGDAAKFIAEAGAGETFERGEGEEILNWLIKVNSGHWQHRTLYKGFSRKHCSSIFASLLDALK